MLSTDSYVPVMRHKSIKMPTKTTIYQAVVLPSLLYGSESWSTTVQEERRHTRCLRRILGVSWQDHEPNEVIFKRTGQVPLINILRHKRLTWLGYVTCTHQTRLPVACSTGNHEGAVAQVDSVYAGKMQCRETCKTLNVPSKRQQWWRRTARSGDRLCWPYVGSAHSGSNVI